MNKIVAGNWKMNGTAAAAKTLGGELCAVSSDVTIILCPPAIHLTLVKDACQGSAVALGGQDCHAKASGAHTGDISAEMLADAGATYVLVGHSERRQHHQESSEKVAAKALAAHRAGLTPIICVGETLKQRLAGQAEALVEEQLRTSIPKELAKGQFLLAYEPVWAIGTGEIPSREDISAMHRHIHSVVGSEAKILYGGSVKAANAEEIMSLPEVDGVLVGGASLDAGEFKAIIAAAKKG